MAFALGENRDQDIRARHLFAARRLHMNDRALHDALKARRRLCVLAVVDDQRRQIGIDISRQRPAQRLDIDIARPHDRGRVLIVDQRQQQMLERRVFVIALVRQRHRAVKGVLQGLRKTRH